MLFGALEDVDLNEEISPKLLRTPAILNQRTVKTLPNTKVHVFPCSKFQKKYNFVFSSPSTITGDLSPEKGADYYNVLWHYLEIKCLDIGVGVSAMIWCLQMTADNLYRQTVTER